MIGLTKIDWLYSLGAGIMAHTPGRFWAYPGYPGESSRAVDTAITDWPVDPFPGGEYNMWVIMGLIPNLGQAFANMTTDWAPVFRFLFFMAASSVAVDFDAPYY